MEKLTKKQLFKKSKNYALECASLLIGLSMNLEHNNEYEIKFDLDDLDEYLDYMVKCVDELHKRLD